MKAPENVQLTVRLWAAAAFGQLLYLVLNVVSVLVDPAPLIAAAREAAEAQDSEQITEDVIVGSAYSSLALLTLLQLLVLGLLVWGVRAIHRRAKHAPNARRLWYVFTFYFVLQAITTFALQPVGDATAQTLFLISGSVQILTGVAAVVGFVFARREDVTTWVENQELSEGD